MHPLKLLLSGTLGLIFSMVSTSCVEATVEAKSWSERFLGCDTETAVDFCILTVLAVLLSYFWFRKPPKEKRFDKKKLINGTWKERLQNITYFFVDKMIGWPYKEGKKIYRLKPGVKLASWYFRRPKAVSWYYKKPPQKPAGVFGYFQAYVLFIPMKLLGRIIFSESESYTYEEQKEIKE